MGLFIVSIPCSLKSHLIPALHEKCRDFFVKGDYARKNHRNILAVF